MMFNEPSRFLREINTDFMLVNGRLGSNRSLYGSENQEPTISYGSFRKLGSSASKPSVGSKPSNPSLAIGTVIEHMRFGVGTVASVEGSGENEKAMVNFENAGTKTLLLKFAKYKIVSKAD